MPLSVILFILGLAAIVGAFVFLRKKKADSFPTIDAKAKSDGGPGE